MRRIRRAFHSLRIAFVLVFFAIFRCVEAQQPSSTRTPSPITHGSFQLPEISAAGFVGKRLLVAADDLATDNGFHMVDFLGDASNRLTSGGSIIATADEKIYRALLVLLQDSNSGSPDPDLITDLEDIAVAPQGDVYLITSHSRTKKDKLPQKRQQLLRLRFDPSSGKVTNAALSSKSLLDALPKEFQAFTKLRPGARDNEGKYTPGFNIEGLAWAPENDLLIGLRSPLVESKAVILRLKNVASLFDRANGPSGTDPVTIEAKLDLGGMGIRGMCYDEKEKGYWLIAGIAPDPDTPDEHLPNEWAIWFWDSNHQLHRCLNKDDLPQDVRLSNPEAVCVVRGNDADYSLLLISDDDKGTPSSYVLVSRSELK